MRRLVSHILIIASVLLSLAGCEQSKILNVNQMVDVLFDIYRFDGAASQLERPLTSEQKVLYYDKIFARHNTNKEQFETSLKWYADHPSEWMEVYEILEKKGLAYADLVKSKELPELKNRRNIAEEVDTFYLWKSRTSMYWYSDLNCDLDTQRIEFALDGSRYFAGSRKIELTLTMRCVPQDASVADKVSVQMVVSCFRRTPDTLSINVPCDSVWHNVRISTGTLKANVSKLEVSLVDITMQDKLKSFEYENIELRNVIDKTKKDHVISAMIDDYNFNKNIRRERQTTCNEKR